MSLFTALIVIYMIIAVASAQTEKVKIISRVHPKYVIEEIRSSPHILYFNVGKYYFKAGRLDDSIEMFSKAVESDSDFAPGHYNLGVAYYEKKEFDSAMDEFRKASELDSSYIKARNSLAMLHFELGDFNSAAEGFLDVIELDPEDPEANFNLAQSYVMRFRKSEESGSEDYTDLEHALYYLKKAEQLQPGFPHASDNINIIQPILDAREVLIRQVN